MIEKFIALLAEFVKSVIDAGGYKGLIALLTLNSSGIPIPSEVILPFSGYLVFKGRFNLFLVATMGAVAATSGPPLRTGSAPGVAGHWSNVMANGC